MAKRSRSRPELAARRKQIGLSQEALADLVGVSVTSISYWERGLAEPSPKYRPALADGLEIDLIRLDRMIDPTTPLRVDRHSVDHWLDLYESLLQGAAAVQQVESIAMPGLLQTRAYAEAVERTNDRPVTDEYIDERVELRLLRQKALHREPDPLDYQVLILDTVLTTVVSGHSVMAEQLDQLDALSHRPNIDIRILPADGRAFPARDGFELVAREVRTRPFLVLTVDVDGPRYEQRPPLLARFVDLYDHLLGIALPPAESLARIRHLQRSHR